MTDIIEGHHLAATALRERLPSDAQVEALHLHGFWYAVVKLVGQEPVAYPAKSVDELQLTFGNTYPGWSYRKWYEDSPVEQCDCLETAVDYYSRTRTRLYSDGKPVLSERDAQVLDSLLDLQAGLPRKPRH